MKKKILSMALASAMLLAASPAVLAEDNSPSVYVDDAVIIFEDQSALIKDDRTLIPARGVFEAMGCSVKWNEENRTVEVKSGDNITVITLTIDNPVMKVATFTSLLNADINEVTLDVAPQIVSDRTMIPLRAVSEALKSDVDWDQEAYRVDITTDQKPASTDGMPTLALRASEESFAEGDTVDIYITASNFAGEGNYVSAVTAAVEYDKENFEFVESTLVNKDEVIQSDVGGNVADFYGMLKTQAGIAAAKSDLAVKEDGDIMKLTFKSLTGKNSVFALSNSYHSTLGFNTTLFVRSSESDNDMMYSGNKLHIDTTPVSVTAAE